MANMSKNNNSKGAAFDLAFANEDQESSRRPQKSNNVVRIWALKIYTGVYTLNSAHIEQCLNHTATILMSKRPKPKLNRACFSGN